MTYKWRSSPCLGEGGVGWDFSRLKETAFDLSLPGFFSTIKIFMNMWTQEQYNSTFSGWNYTISLFYIFFSYLTSIKNAKYLFQMHTLLTNFYIWNKFKPKTHSILYIDNSNSVCAKQVEKRPNISYLIFVFKNCYKFKFDGLCVLEI